jgi:uncharacterized membrane protein YuzA (DUF378 family)
MDRTDTQVRETERVRDEDVYRRPAGLPSQRLNALDWVALWLTIIGGINWGLIGLFDFNLVANIFGVMTLTTRIIYSLVGLSSLYMIYLSTRLLKRVVGAAARV